MSNSFENEETEDIQHDLAMEYATLPSLGDPSLAKEMEDELHARNAKLPINCRFVYSPYARFNRKLEYEVPR